MAVCRTAPKHMHPSGFRGQKGGLGHAGPQEPAGLAGWVTWSPRGLSKKALHR